MTDQQQSALTHDLARRASADLEIVLNRHFAVMQELLSPADCAVAIMLIANGVATGGAHYALQIRKDGQNPDELWQMMSEHLPKLFMATKPIVMAKIAEQPQ